MVLYDSGGDRLLSGVPRLPPPKRLPPESLFVLSQLNLNCCHAGESVAGAMHFLPGKISALTSHFSGARIACEQYRPDL